MSIKACRNKQGTALPAIIVLVAVLGIMAVAALRTTSDDRQASHGVRDRTRALYAAEAGIQAITASWDSVRWDTLMSQPGDSAVIPWQTIPQNGASYRGTLHLVSGTIGAKVFNLVVDGRSGGPREGHQALSVQFAKNVLFNYAVYGRDSVLFRGNGTIWGDVGAGGDIELSGGNAAVSGDATAGGTVIDPFSNITGTVTTGATMPTVPNVACPTGPYGGVPTGVNPHINFNSVTGDLLLTGSSTKTFAGGTYFYRNFIKTSSGDMLVPFGAYVTIYVSDSLSMTGQGFTNTNNDPSHLLIYGCDTNTTNWSIGGGAVAHFSLYAPNHFLYLGGNGDKYGAIISGGMDISGGGNIYFDPSGSMIGRYLPLPGSWVELTD